jgi:hypothetical protein
VRQICLAHLLRDAQFAIDEGCATFAPGFRMLLLRAVAIGRLSEPKFTVPVMLRAPDTHDSQNSDGLI